MESHEQPDPMRTMEYCEQCKCWFNRGERCLCNPKPLEARGVWGEFE